jgi:hypothetical protein
MAWEIGKRGAVMSRIGAFGRGIQKHRRKPSFAINRAGGFGYRTLAILIHCNL